MRDLVISTTIVAVWSILGFGVYRYPHSRILWWLFWISIAITMIPRVVQLVVSVWKIMRSVVLRIRRQFGTTPT